MEFPKDYMPESIREMQGKPNPLGMMFVIEVLIGIVFCAGLWLIFRN